MNDPKWMQDLRASLLRAAHERGVVVVMVDVHDTTGTAAVVADGCACGYSPEADMAAALYLVGDGPENASGR